MREERNAFRILVGTPKGERYDVVVWTGLISLRIGAGGGLL
jgi:hypothetical protein